MMKQKLLLLFAILATAINASAEVGDTFEAVNEGVTIYYNILSEDDKTCEVTYQNQSSADYTATTINIPSKVTNSATSTEYTVTSIGSNAFYDCTGLTSVTIPNSVTSIEGNAFRNCTSLTTINIPSSVTSIATYAFDGCTSLPVDGNVYYADTYLVGVDDKTLSTYTIKAGTKWIGFHAFENCTYLTTITIPEGVTSIGVSAFSGCTSLTKVEMPNTVTEIGSQAFKDCTSLETEDNVRYAGTCLVGVADNTKNTYTIKAGTKWIGYQAFENCTNLTTITIPNSVTSIGEYSFRYCSKLTSVTIPNGVTTIGRNAFEGCSNLASVNIPNGVTEVGQEMFKNCKALTSINIPDGVTSIGFNAFFNCSSLKEVTIPNSVTSIGTWAFSYTALTSVNIPDAVTSIGSNAFYNCTSLTSVTFGNSVTSIGSSAFRGCSKLTEITIPNTVTSIGEQAFRECSALSSVNIPEGITTLEQLTFNGCTSLTSVVIPNSVTTIGNSVFYYCTKLASVTIGNSVTSIGSTPFSKCPLLKSFSGTFASDDGRCLIKDNELIAFAPAGLTTYSIPDGITTIGNEMFWNSELTSVTIPSSVTKIGADAFNNCSKLQTIISFCETPPECVSSRNGCFNNVPSSCKLIVPNATAVTAYKEASEWKDLKNILSNQVINYTSSDGSAVQLAEGAFTGINGSSLTVTSAYTNGQGTFTIEGIATTIGAEAFKDKTALTSITIPTSITSIGESAFSGSGLTSMEIPASVTSIGDGAFANCANLASFTDQYASTDNRCLVDNENKLIAFAPAGLETYTIPDVVTTIGVSVFSGCTDLMSITIPNQVTDIGASAFSGCTGLTKITSLNATPPTATENTFYNVDKDNCKVLVPTAAAVTAYKAADYWSAFKNITSNQIIRYKSSEEVKPNDDASFGDGVTYDSESSTYDSESGTGMMAFNIDVTKIGEEAFKENTNLTWVEIPETVTEIGASAFNGCTGLTSVAIPDKVTTIGASAFNGCSVLESLTIGSSVTTIGESAFSDCSKLASVTIPNSVTSIGTTAFSNSGLTSLTVENSDPANITLGETVFSEVNTGDCTLNVPSGSQALYAAADQWKEFGVKDITNIIFYTSSEKVEPNTDTFGDGVTIVSNTFVNGQGKIVLSDNATTIGAEAFKDKTTLTSVTIPNSVTTIGTSAFSGCSGMTGVTIGSSVETIGEKAFYGCSKLSSVVIPDKVTAIGVSAFQSCSELATVTIGENVETIETSAFNGCSKLSSVVIPDKVTAISTSAFQSCSALESLTIGEKVETIGEKAFYGCSKLSSVTIPNSVTTISTSAFQSCSGMESLTIGSSVTTIGTSAFYGCSGLTSVTIPESVTTIGSSAFYSCSKLTSITIPDKVTKIDNSTFSGCTLLASVMMGKNVESIGNYAFQNCKGLESITIPETVTTIGSSMFYGCTSLTSVTIPNKVTTINYSAFQNCTALTSVTIGNSVTSIGTSVFNGCKALATITSLRATPPTAQSNTFYNVPTSTCKVYVPNATAVEDYNKANYWKNFKNIINAENLIIRYTASEKVTPKDGADFGTSITIVSNEYDIDSEEGTITFSGEVTKIGDEAFSNCDKLTSIIFPEIVTSVGASAFSGCTALTSTTIPGSVTEIGTSAFANCTALNSLTVERINPANITLGETVFSGVNTGDCTLNVPSGSETLYAAAEQWKAFTKPQGITNTIFYTASAKVALSSTTVFGDGVTFVSNTFVKDHGKIVFDADVTSIGTSAFNSKSSMTAVAIPNTVTTIGASAFYNCSKLTSVTIPNGVTTIGGSAFRSCSNLKSVEILDGVTAIGDYTFYGCSKLESVTIPESVTSIGTYAFYNCYVLESVTIPDGVTTIGTNTFYGCKGLTEVTIPDGVTTIGGSAFYGCKGLTEVTIPEAVTKIDNYAFSGCSGLTTITSLCETPPTAQSYTFNSVNKETCTVIVPTAAAVDLYKAATGWKDFTNYLAATKIIYYTSSKGKIEPKDGTTFGTDVTYDSNSNTFDEGSGKGMIIFSGEVTEIGVDSENQGAFSGCTNLTSVTIPATVTSIGNWAFNNTGLTTVEIPTSVTTIGTQAFTSCHSLASFTGKFASSDNLCLIDNNKKLIAFAPAEQTEYSIPSGVTKIGEGAFYSFDKLTSVTIPEGVTEIETNAFASSGLKEVISLSESVPELGTSCFDGVASGFVIKVPGMAIGSYHSSWTAYQDKLQAISLALTDATEYKYAFDFVSGETTYTRNFPNDKWQGLFLPFAMNYSDWSEYGEMAQLTGVGTDGVLDWKTIESGSIEAGTPYIFKPKAEGKITFTVTDATLKSCDSKTNVTPADGYTLSGTYTEKTDMADNSSKIYALYNGDFYYTTDNSKTLKPYRIFLTVPTASGARIYSRINGENVTAIEGIDVDIDVDGQRLYNLQGIRVDDSYKGIVIINGKKVVRK